MDNEEVMSTSEWLGTLLVLTLVPVVNIIMMFVWAFGNGNANRKNFCRAYLIIFAISFVLGILLVVMFGSVILANIASNPSSIPQM